MVSCGQNLHDYRTVIHFTTAFVLHDQKNWHFGFAYIFIWVRKFDSDSLTETKNWSGRNEVIETSGRLHHLWPQNKRLRAPWTTDWMHTGQDRWIQTEMVFTLAKNDTKPNPFEIISLQTTRKENNRKTEETLARAVVTLETERIKGSNPWCLWWWWWWTEGGMIINICWYSCKVPVILVRF